MMLHHLQNARRDDLSRVRQPTAVSQFQYPKMLSSKMRRRRKGLERPMEADSSSIFPIQSVVSWRSFVVREVVQWQEADEMCGTGL